MTISLSRALKTVLTSMALICSMAKTSYADIHHNNDPAELSSTASKHAPIGVMGDHRHGKGEVMLSYRYMYMDMNGNRKGTNSINPATIATTIVNPFAGPPTVRVVPTDMQMEMHMIGAMYAPTDDITLMLMGMWKENTMDHITFAGATGTTVLGTFRTESKGWGDTRISALVKLYDDETHNVHLNLGLSLPTGSIKEEDTVLAPTGATPRLRLPYAMQLGTGTFDLLPGITYQGYDGKWNWGAQYTAEIRLEDENDQGYSHGDRHEITAWGAYEWAPWVSTSLRITGRTQDEINGNDPRITAPVQTANPDNYGGNIIEAGVGVNFVIPRGLLKDHRFAIEATAPLHRDLNGVQLETDMAITAGWQYAF